MLNNFSSFKIVVITFALALSVGFIFGQSNYCLAATSDYNPAGNLTGVGKDTGLEGDLKPLTSTVIKGILSVVGTIFFILMVYAGFLWMTAAGNEDRIEKAQQIIFMSVIGVAIIMAAYAITAFVSYSLTGSTK